MLFPTLWLETFMDTRIHRAQGRKNAINLLQLRTGLHWSVEFSPESLALHTFPNLAYKLNMLGDELAWDEYALQTLIRGINKIRDLRTRYLCGDVATGTPLGTHPQLDMRLTNLHDILLNLQDKTTRTIQSTNMHLQTVSSDPNY
jgi:hypothetical protein